MGPESRVPSDFADDVVDAAVFHRCGRVVGGAEADAREAAVAALAVGLQAEQFEPVEVEVLMREEADFTEGGGAFGFLQVVERAEDGVAAFGAEVPGVALRGGKAVADQGGEFEGGVVGPGADF